MNGKPCYPMENIVYKSGGIGAVREYRNIVGVYSIDEDGNKQYSHYWDENAKEKRRMKYALICNYSGWYIGNNKYIDNLVQHPGVVNHPDNAKVFESLDIAKLFAKIYNAEVVTLHSDTYFPELKLYRYKLSGIRAKKAGNELKKKMEESK